MISLTYAITMVLQSPSKYYQVSTYINPPDAKDPGVGRLCGVGMSDGIYYCQYTADGGATWSPPQQKDGFQGVYITVVGANACVIGREADVRCTDNIDGTLNDSGTYDVDFGKIDGGDLEEIKMDSTTGMMCLQNSNSQLWCAPFATENVEWVQITPNGDGIISVALDGGYVYISKEDGIYKSSTGLTNPVDPNLEFTLLYPSYQLDQMAVLGNILCGVTPNLNKSFLKCLDMSQTFYMPDTISTQDLIMYPEIWVGGTQGWSYVSMTYGLTFANVMGDSGDYYATNNLTTEWAYFATGTGEYQ
eukprot:NODE_393_length_8140_cov_0.738341.p5 type:complete len:304 gc:universal NODE_393_length_8140_cov_0.738341:1862-951(-)